MMHRRHFLNAGAASLLAPSMPAWADPYPGRRPVKFISSVTAGTATDATVRFMAEMLAKRLDGSFVVDPRPGAGGIVASQEVARAPADGYALLFGGIGHYLAQPLAGTTQTYDPVKDFVPIAKVASASVVIVVKADSPYKTLADLVKGMKAHPGKLTYSSGGIGATAHLCGVMLNEATQTQALHVPYKGTGPAVVDVAGGQVDFTCQAAAAVLPMLQTAKLRPLAVTSRRRWTSLPDVPTAIEAELPDFLVSSWMGALAPAGTPKPIVQTLSDEMVRAATTSEFRSFCDKQMMDVDIVGHAQWASDAAREDAYWQKISALLRK